MFLSPVSFADGSVHYLPVSRTQSAPILVGPLQQASSPFRAEAAQPPAFSEAQDLLESSVPHCHSTAFAFLQSLALGDRVFSVSEPLAPAGNLSGVARVQSLSAAPLLPNALWNSGLWDIAAPTDGHAGFPLAPCLASPVDHDLTGVRRTTQVTPVPGTPAMNQERKAKTPPVQGYVYKDNVHGLERFVCTLQTGEVLDLLVEPSMEPQQFPSELWDSYAFYKNSRKTNRVCYETQMNRLLCRLMYLNINVLQNYGKDVISQIATAYRNCDPKTKSRRARGSMSRRRSQQEQTSEGLLPSPMHKSVSTIDAASGSFKHPQLQRAGSTAAGLAFGRRASSTLSTLGSDAEEVTSNSSLSLSPHSTLIQEVGDILREQSNDFGSSLSSASAQSSGDLVANMMATLAVQKANMAAPFWSETAGLFSSPFGAQEPNNPRPDGQPMHMELFAHANTPPVGLVPGISLTSHHSDEWVNWDSA